MARAGKLGHPFGWGRAGGGRERQVARLDPPPLGGGCQAFEGPAEAEQAVFAPRGADELEADRQAF
jgi:hypothetical protein